MAQSVIQENALFRPDPRAQLFLHGHGPIAARPADPMRLAAWPERDGLAGLLTALGGGDAFCVHAAPVAEAPAWVPGHLYCTTSGTSGAPKRVRRSHGSWIASFETNRALFGISHADRYAVLGGLEHSLTLYALIEALHLGADAEVLSGLRPDRQAALLAARGVTVLYATPAQLRLLCAAQDGPADAVRLILCGGGFLDAVTRATLGMAFPSARVVAFYGASETSFITLTDDATPEGAVGRAYPGVEISVRGPEGEALPHDQISEIWVRSPYLFAGYAGGGSGDTRWRDGFLTVGEMGRLDAEGNLFLAGRISRMFTVADRNLFPEELEDALRALPGVVEAAVLPVPDARRGQVPVAVVTGEALDGAALLVACRRALGAEVAPRRVQVVQDWPRLASGKTDYRAIQALI